MALANLAAAGFTDLDRSELTEVNGGGFWSWLGSLISPEVFLVALLIDLFIHPQDCADDWWEGWDAF